MDTRELQERIEYHLASLKAIKTEIGKRIVGQDEMIRGLLMAFIAGGHTLIEGVPGLGKTLTVKTLAGIVRSDFRRIQFTPDLLPADLIGTMIYRQDLGEFRARKGPVFCNILLADEINRAPAKVQSALLEAMEERQVTLGDTTHLLPNPFYVVATQNPIEQDGTYPLPEAQVDRFLLKLQVPYPKATEELTIMENLGFSPLPPVQKTVDPVLFREVAETAAAIDMDVRIRQYVVALVEGTRDEGRKNRPYGKYIRYGASPRATLGLFRCGKIEALLAGRNHVLPEDIKAVALPVLRHRILLSYEGEAADKTTDEVIRELLDTITVP